MAIKSLFTLNSLRNKFQVQQARGKQKLFSDWSLVAGRPGLSLQKQTTQDVGTESPTHAFPLLVQPLLLPGPATALPPSAASHGSQPPGWLTHPVSWRPFWFYCWRPRVQGRPWVWVDQDNWSPDSALSPKTAHPTVAPIGSSLSSSRCLCLGLGDISWMQRALLGLSPSA